MYRCGCLRKDQSESGWAYYYDCSRSYERETDVCTSVSVNVSFHVRVSVSLSL